MTPAIPFRNRSARYWKFAVASYVAFLFQLMGLQWLTWTHFDGIKSVINRGCINFRQIGELFVLFVVCMIITSYSMNWAEISRKEIGE